MRGAGDTDLLPPPDELALDRFRNVAKALGEGPI